jgi:hypothetical protein
MIFQVNFFDVKTSHFLKWFGFKEWN